MSGHERTSTGESMAAVRPIVNTHVHLPPNFSAFETVEDAVGTAAAEGVRVLGASNFHDRGSTAGSRRLPPPPGSSRCSASSPSASSMPSEMPG